MESVLLQALVEKVQALEKGVGEVHDQLSGQRDLLKETHMCLSAVEEEIKKMLPGFSFPREQAAGLSSQLTHVTRLLAHPPQRDVRHHHYISKALVLSGVLFLVVVIEAALLARAWSRGAQERESDLKYRSLKLSPDPGLQKVLFYTDSLYLEDGKAFRREVLQKEAWTYKQEMLQQQIKQKEQEVQRLKQRAREVQ